MAEEVRIEEHVVPLRGIDPDKEQPDRELGGDRKIFVLGVKEEFRSWKATFIY